MKTIILSLAVLAAAFTTTAQQTNATFFGTVQDWIASQNPANSWTNARGTFNAGVATIQNSKASLCNELRLTLDVWKNFALEATTRDSGVAGTFVSGQFGIGYGIKIVDVKLTPFVEGGRDFVNPEKWFGEAGIRAEKRMTRFTHVGIGIANQFPANRQVFSSWLGFSF